MATSYIEIEQEKQRAAASFHPRITETRKSRENQPKFGFPAAVARRVLAVQWPGCWRELTVCWRPGAGRTRTVRMHTTVVTAVGWKEVLGREPCVVAKAVG